MRPCEHVLFENTHASHFTEAYPIGNGRLGAMIYGEPDRMRIGLNCDELWEGHRTELSGEFDPALFAEVKRLTLEGKYLEAQKLFEGNFAVFAGGGFRTLGDLFVELPTGRVENYRRSLDIRTGLATVSFALDGSPVTITAIASYPTSTVLLNLRSEREIAIKVIEKLAMIRRSEAKDGVLLLHGECDSLCARQKTVGKKIPNYENHHGVRFCAALSVRSDGECSVTDGGFSLIGCDMTIAISCESSYFGGRENGREGFESDAFSKVKAAISRDFSDLESEHIADVTALFDRVALELDSPDTSDIPTTERVRRFAAGEGDYSLVTLLFNLGRYYLIATSRDGSRPPNLQGNWCDSDSPKWSSNYTININTEMNYWAALPTATPELLSPLEEHLELLAETGREHAREAYGVCGICASHNTDIFGQVAPAFGMARWSYFPVSFAWLLRELYNKYEYTLDRSYLERIYPLIEGAAEFILGSLVYDGEYMILTPGTSPENVYRLDGEECSVARSSTMFASIARECLEFYLSASDILGRSSEYIERAREALPKMLPLRITSDGRIEEWYFGGESHSPEECEIHHRHISHLYDLYPATKINRNTPELMAAARRSLEVRGDEATGWSLGWKINCYARLGDGCGVMRLVRMFLRPVAAECVDVFAGGGVYPNLMCAHPPFQIDGNFGFTAAVCEMLISADGDPLPALPPELHTGSLRGVAIKGRRFADISWRDGRLEELKIYTK